MLPKCIKIYNWAIIQIRSNYSGKLFLKWKKEKYSSHGTSTQYFEQVLILNTQYDYEMTKGDQEKLLNNDMIGPYKYFGHQPEASDKKSLECIFWSTKSHKISFCKIWY